MRASSICSSYRNCFQFPRLEGRRDHYHFGYGNHHGCGSSAPSSTACAGNECRQLPSSVISRIHERNLHTQNRHLLRLSASSTFAESPLLQLQHDRRGHLLRGNSMENTNMLQLLSTQSPRRFAVISRSLDRKNYNIRSSSVRCFGSDATNSSTAEKSDVTKQHSEPKSKTTVPKEYLAAIKSEVDEMESSPPTSTISQQDPTFPPAKTQDDFADYLNGAEVLLDGEGGLIMKRKSLDQNTSSDRDNAISSSSSSSPPSSRPLDQSVSGSALTSSAIGTDEDDVNKGSESQTPTDAPTSTSTNAIYQYKFSSSDATLSDPQRHLDRRRAMEQKLQEQQAESRATTMRNVQRALAGNFIIAAAKLAAALSSGSSAMLSEFVHSVVDCGNQALLLVGLNTSKHAPDRSHPYGYGKAIYFWALVSALGTFFLGAGISMTHAVGELINPSIHSEVPNEVWGVLALSFVVDGYVFKETIQGIRASMRIDGDKDKSFWTYVTTKVRDPATLAVLLEDGAACLGVVLAIGGIGLTQYTGMPVFDGMAGVGIAGLLAVVGMSLATINHRFLIGQGLDKATREDIEKIILSRRSIDHVYSVQSQWTGPDTFSYKAEVDFDGTFLAAKLLPRYQQEFFDAKQSLDRDLRVLLSWYAEDVMRAVEREVRHIEEEIRMKYPAAQYIELEPMSKDADRYAIDDGMKAQLRRVEIDVLNRYLKSLYKIKEGGPVGAGSDTSQQS
ncbi:hypothetical protein ACHAXH_005922 [Discostella pseudostelligera]